MALQKTTLSLNLAKGLNQKTDDKVLEPGQMSQVSDCVFDKDGRLTKRFGQDSLSTAFQGGPGYIRPVAVGSGLQKSKVFSHENQLLIANDGSLFARLQNQSQWQFKGTYLPLSISAQSVDQTQKTYDMALVNGISVYAGANSVVFVEEATGTVINRVGLTSLTETVLKVIQFQNACFIVTADQPSNPGNLYLYTVNLTIGTLRPRMVIATDLTVTNATGSSFYTLKDSYRRCDVTVTSSGSALGEAAFITYASTGNLKIIPISNTGTVLSIGVFDTGILASNVSALGIYVEPTVDANLLHLSTAQDQVGVSYTAWTFSATQFTNTYPKALVLAAQKFFNYIAMAIEPVANSKLYIFADTRICATVTGGGSTDPGSGFYFPAGANYPLGSKATRAEFGTPHTFDQPLYQIVLIGSTAQTAGLFGTGYILASKPIRDTGKTRLLLPVTVISPLQPTNLLLDVLEGSLTPGVPNIQAKWLSGNAATTISALPTLSTECTSYLVHRYPSVYPFNTPVSNTSAIFSLPLGNTAKISAGVYRFASAGYASTINFAPQSAPQSVYQAKTTHLTGGLLWAYDGSELTEHNFLISPENTDAWIGQNAGFTFQVTVPSSGYTYTTVSVPPAAFITMNGSWWTFSANGGNYYIWYTVDGFGVNPNLSGIGAILVALNSGDTAADVAHKTCAVLNARGDLTATLSTVGTSEFLIAPFNVGTGNAPAAGGTSPNDGMLTASASYQYCAVFKYVDRNGQLYRSAPSVAVTQVASAAPASGVFTVWIPPITNRNLNECEVEVYRTLANTSEFHLANTSKLTFNSSVVRLSVVDKMPDSVLATKQLLYTNGGILENSNFGVCTALSTYRNRVLVSLGDDPTAVYYSKTISAGEPVNFSSFNELRFDDDSLSVTAHAQMDDKLCVFKANSTYVTSGDGTNDLGHGDTFQLPIRMPGDIGCINPNSLILSNLGLIFQSNQKGLYVLGRGLGLSYIGAAIDNYKGNQISGAVLTRNFDHIVFTLSDSDISLVYNQLLDRWDTWTNQGADSACLWQGAFARVLNTGKVFVESSNFLDNDQGATSVINRMVETPWLKLKGMAGFQRIYAFQLIGEYKSPHTLQFNVIYDYDMTTLKSYTLDTSLIVSTPPYQVECQPERQKCEAMKIQITEVTGAGSGECATWNSLDFEVGLKSGLNKIKATKSV